jgi:predicted small secreted protein
VPPVRFAYCVAAAAVVLAGCGSSGYGRDVKGFTQQAEVPAEQEVLRSIATYRTTKDAKLACSLITPGFLKSRFEDKPKLCEAVARHQQKRELPKKARVTSLSGTSAKVRVDEPTATKSVYEMERVSGTWKIDDIVEAP